MDDYRMPEWIDVKDELPDGGVRILVADCKTGKIGLGEYDLAHCWGWVCGDIVRPTHRMPLPDPPEDTNRRCENCRYWTRYGKVCQNTKSPFFGLVTDMSCDWCMYWMSLTAHHECIVGRWGENE